MAGIVGQGLHSFEAGARQWMRERPSLSEGFRQAQVGVKKMHWREAVLASNRKTRKKLHCYRAHFSQRFSTFRAAVVQRQCPSKLAFTACDRPWLHEVPPANRANSTDMECQDEL